ncbi:LpqB family beta-propeller domain-containing protein [Bifidobacterium margollesii]|nr:LpqB family beta-propeller domain-containing protein [Bifidobacterium margollesii]
MRWFREWNRESGIRRAVRIAGAVALVASLTLVSGCSMGLPTSGPVERVSLTQNEDHRVYIDPQGPSEDAEPEQIVRGFIDSLPAGPQSDGFKVAKEFLTDAARKTWKPDAKTVIYSGELQISREADTMDLQSRQPSRVTVSISYNSIGAVDSRGVYSAEGASGSSRIELRLVKVDGQWRISSLPDGISISQSGFFQVFRQVELYQLADSGRTLIPDQRWFAWRQWRTLAVRELLREPANWLGDAAQSVGDGAIALAMDSVPMSQGVVQVKLTNSVMSLTVDERAKLIRRIRLTLGDGSGEYRLSVVDDAGQDLSNADENENISIDQPPRHLYTLANNFILSIASNNIVRLGDVAGRFDGAVGMAFTERGGAILRPDGIVECVTKDTDACGTLFGGNEASIIREGIDDEIWAVSKDSSQIMVHVNGQERRFSASMFEGRQITAFDIAPEGSRAVVALGPKKGVDGGRIVMIGISRDSNRLPSGLSSHPNTISNRSNIVSLTFYNESTVVYALRDAGSGYQQLSPGPESPQRLPEDTRELVAGQIDQTQSLIALDGDGMVRYARASLNASWRVLDYQTDAITSGW